MKKPHLGATCHVSRWRGGISRNGDFVYGYPAEERKNRIVTYSKTLNRKVTLYPGTCWWDGSSSAWLDPAAVPRLRGGSLMGCACHPKH